MFGKIFLKEWRDNWLLLSLTALVLAALIVLGISGQDKATVGVAGVLLILVLPVTALLLGSGAYGSEYKDNAWSYLFSRPVRKSTVWISKYLALLSFLAAAFLILNLAVAILPGLKAVLADFYAPSFVGRVVLYGLVIFLIFTIAYSLSILSEKPLIVLALSVLIGGLIFWLHTQFIQFFRERYGTWGFFAWFGLFIAVSFALASILTLAKVDFGQKAKKTWAFIWFVLLFLALSFLAEILIVSKGHPLAKPGIVFWQTSKIHDTAYLGTYTGRLMRYDSQKDAFRPMPGVFNDYGLDLEFSSAGGKIGFIKYSHAGRLWGGMTPSEACAANLDGSQVTTLARFYGKDSALNGWSPWSNILISSDGSQAAFVAVPPPREKGKTQPHLYWMKVDGSALKSKPLDFLGKSSVKLLSWSEDGKDIVLRLAEKSVHSLWVRIIRFSLDAGVGRTWETRLPFPNNYEWIPGSSLSPTRRYLITQLWDETQEKEATALLDLASFKIKEIGTNVPLFGRTWSPRDDRLAFTSFRSQGVWVYAALEGSLKKAWEQPDKRIRLSFDWLADGRLLVAGKEKDGGDTLVLLKEDFSPDRRIKFPEEIWRKIALPQAYYRYILIGLEEKALIVSESGAWRLDLKTEQWTKVY